MKKIRGFLLKTRVTTVVRCFFRRKRSPAGYIQLGERPACKAARSVSAICSWARRLKTKAKAICLRNPGYLPMGCEPIREKQTSPPVPKGHMAVYVGQKDGDSRRFLVPVIYFNHPLFGQLLMEAEKEYGYGHPGGITIPCRISEFESVKTKIAAGSGGRKMMTWRRPG